MLVYQNKSTTFTSDNSNKAVILNLAKMKTQNVNFAALVDRFGRKSGSHLFPLWNYFFVPQTKAQYNKWRLENLKGIIDQNLLMSEKDVVLIKAFFPSAEIKPTKSGSMFRVVNFEAFQKEVKNQIFA